ncbi:MAG: glycine zipper 2TM domain-containing protein, partial [candidate division WOR-3 bacterium]
NHRYAILPSNIASFLKLAQDPNQQQSSGDGSSGQQAGGGQSPTPSAVSQPSQSQQAQPHPTPQEAQAIPPGAVVGTEQQEQHEWRDLSPLLGAALGLYLGGKAFGSEGKFDILGGVIGAIAGLMMGNKIKLIMEYQQAKALEEKQRKQQQQQNVQQAVQAGAGQVVPGQQIPVVAPQSGPSFWRSPTSIYDVLSIGLLIGSLIMGGWKTWKYFKG